MTLTTRDIIASDSRYRFIGNKRCPRCKGRLWSHPEGFVEICENQGNGCEYHIVGG